MASHERKCWNCGNIAMHADNVVPWVLCTKCGSQDTRLKREEPVVISRSPWAIAEEWYTETQIAMSIQRFDDEIPADVRSEAFAKWLTHQYRLAMAKGIQLGRDGTQDAPTVIE